ncbi:hypothetical protein FPZ41_44085 [Streptomyces sp. K1PN6]|uniref:Uncharacterized protein n=1 Tax=Streptomyces acidicola TaxID=2596892 RepID=A0A5N8X6T9_9ACTN|nr:hypothetical protein [Streptomyces acidicola]
MPGPRAGCARSPAIRRPGCCPRRRTRGGCRGTRSAADGRVADGRPGCGRPARTGIHGDSTRSAPAGQGLSVARALMEP